MFFLESNRGNKSLADGDITYTEFLLAASGAIKMNEIHERKVIYAQSDGNMDNVAAVILGKYQEIL